MIKTPGFVLFFTTLAVGYVHVIIAFVTLLAYTVLIPTVYSDSPGMYFLSGTISALLLLNIASNYYLIRACPSFYDGSTAKVVDGSTAKVVDGNSGNTEEQAGWRQCPTCAITVPPRTHHCAICRRCIIVRDHHCYFAAICIGALNRRHFVRFLFHSAMSSTYAVYGLFQASVILYPVDAYYKMFLPVSVFHWLYGEISEWSLGLNALLYMCVMSCISSYGLFLYQIFLLLQGKVSYEYQRQRAWWRVGLNGWNRGDLEPYLSLASFLPLELFYGDTWNAATTLQSDIASKLV